jgi:uncharacterized DUF497 family protein
VYEWDEGKRAANLRDHKVDFAVARDFEWETALVVVDDREDYGELREAALGFVGVRLHVMVFTRRADSIRIISLRKADKIEVRRYVRTIER